MTLKKRLIGLNTLLILSLALTACGPQETPAPTIDANQLFTQAAVTVIAQLTQNAPTVTPTIPATNTPEATATLAALPTLAMLPTLAPMPTATSAAANSPDKALYVTQSPADNTSVKTGQVFNIIWRLRNVGTTTWNQNYQYRFYSAANKIPTSANGYNLTTTVAPNAEVELKVVATAPGTPGTYDTRWVLTNPEGVNFSSFDLTLNVVQGSSGSSSEATATGVPNACDTQELAGAPWVLDPGSSKDFTISGGQATVYFVANTTTNSGINIKAPSYNNDVPVGQSVSAEHFGSPSKDPSSFTITVTGSASVKITKILYWAANNSCP